MPSAGRPPLVVDFATSVVAEGKVRNARIEGRPIPDGWVLDREGQPTVDPTDLYDDGMLLPAGAYKGYGLSVLVELLGGLLTGMGAPMLPEAGRFINGMLFIILDIGTFRSVEEFEADARRLGDILVETPTDAETDCVLLPGDLEERTRAARARGVPIDAGTWDALRRSGGPSS